MNKKTFFKIVAITLASSMMFTSCIGSFKLSKNLLSWNRSLDSKFVNELVFIAFNIIPVYSISILADALVLNTIEFWTGDNPVADAGTIKKVETEKGTYAIETKTDGYKIQKEGEEKSVDLVYDKATKTWSVNAEGETNKLLSFTEDGNVSMFLPDGTTMNVTPNQAGVLAFEQVASQYSFFATK